MSLRTRDFETAQTGGGAVGSSRQQPEITGGSRIIGSPLLYLTGFRRQRLLHILVHSGSGGVGFPDFSLYLI
jgi:hypothetical protein